MQHASNHTGKRTARPYQLTRAGSRLARYLEYVESTAAPPDEPRPQPPSIIQSELNRLYGELERCQEEMFRPTCPNWRYDELLRDVREIREEIAGYEDPDRQPEDGDRDTEDAEYDPRPDYDRDHTDDDDDYGAHSPEED